MIKKVKKRDGTIQEYRVEKIKTALLKALNEVNEPQWKTQCFDIDKLVNEIQCEIEEKANKLQPTTDIDTVGIEFIQDCVEDVLMDFNLKKTAKAYILYRSEHKNVRFLKERIDYMNEYSNSDTNAASASETDANSNVTTKNVANLEGEVYKQTNRAIQRYRMKEQLNKMFPEVASQYAQDLKNGIIYVHDEASSPVLKYYCEAVTLYPLMTEGVGNLDKVTPSAPNDIESFSGQVTNAVFLLSSQCKGAVALGDYFVALNYYVVSEFGEKWYERLDEVVTKNLKKNHNIKYFIRKGMKQFIYGVNQPAGNRSYNSPFTNVSYYDSVYFNALFGDFYYPDGTQPEWKAIDTLQRMFMELHRELRLIKPLTFPVSTIAMVHNNKEFLDKEYKELCAEEWAKGGSFFCYNSDNPSSLASCCRVLNEISDNTFSSTTGMTGIMTGSCNVITLNINRIVQNWSKEYKESMEGMDYADLHTFYAPQSGFKEYLINILERVYKYHIAFKTMLYDYEDKGMFTASNAGYIYMKKLYSTIGVIGYFEAAKFLGIETSNNEEYKEFLSLILGTIKEQNKIHSIKDKKRPFLFNSECIPGEQTAIRFYDKDKKDGYYVPEDQNLYNCYFYNPWDNTSVLDKLALHGRDINKFSDGGQACHVNLDAHLTKEQYLKILDFALANGTNYFTFNIPMSECKDCGHTVNSPIDKCPICGSDNIRYWTRIIGYLTAVDNWSKGRQIEQKTRVYTKEEDIKL